MADRVTVAEAASILCVSVDAVRKRLQRGTLAGGKEGNTWYVLLRQDADRTPTGHSQERPDAFGQPARETAGGAGHRQDADRTPRQDVDRTRQDVSGELLDGDPVLRAAVLATELSGLQALLAQTQDQLAAARDEAQFLRERLKEQEAVISRLSEAQVEALRRRDILEAQEQQALPETASGRAGRVNRPWWKFWR
jgi:hypothetical protein